MKVTTLAVFIFALAILLSAAACEDTAGDGQSAVQDSETGSEPSDLKVGDCVLLPEATVVGCSEPHAGEVVNVFSIKGDQYPGDDAVLREVDEGCPAIFTATYPTRTSWNQLGDREVVCIRTASLNLEFGDCIIYSGRVQWVSCSRAHDAEALDTFEVAGTTFPGEDAIADYAEQNCPAHANWYLYPTEETWSVGHRAITCLDRAPN